jgi:hypothetical protein
MVVAAVLLRNCGMHHTCRTCKRRVDVRKQCVDVMPMRHDGISDSRYLPLPTFKSCVFV